MESAWVTKPLWWRRRCTATPMQLWVRRRGGPTLCAAISGIEMCLWDLLGKSLGVPVWQLLGGAVRDRIRVYTRPRGSTSAELAASAKQVVARGYSAMKFCPFEKVHIVDHYGLVEEAA